MYGLDMLYFLNLYDWIVYLVMLFFFFVMLVLFVGMCLRMATYDYYFGYSGRCNMLGYWVMVLYIIVFMMSVLFFVIVFFEVVFVL